MMSGKLNELVSAQDRVSKLIWMSMCAGLVVYAALPQFLFGVRASLPGEGSESILPYLVVAAVASAVASIMYFRRQLSDEKFVSLLHEPVSPQKISAETPATVGKNQLLADLESMSPEDLRVFGVVRSLQTPFVVALALNESVGIYGLVAAFSMQDALVVLPFVAAALGLQFNIFPKTAALAERIQTLSLTVPTA